MYMIVSSLGGYFFVWSEVHLYGWNDESSTKSYNPGKLATFGNNVQLGIMLIEILFTLFEELTC